MKGREGKQYFNSAAHWTSNAEAICLHNASTHQITLSRTFVDAYLFILKSIPRTNFYDLNMLGMLVDVPTNLQ